MKILKFFACFAFAMLLVALRAVVLVDLWDWFITPLGAVSLTFGLALGLLFFIGLFTAGLPREKSEDPNVSNFVFQCTNSVINSLMAWGFGWLVVTFLV